MKRCGLIIRRSSWSIRNDPRSLSGTWLHRDRSISGSFDVDVQNDKSTGLDLHYFEIPLIENNRLVGAFPNVNGTCASV